MVKVKIMLLGLAVLAALSACAGGEPSGKPLVITRETDGYLQQYMREINAGRAGAFAVSEDGVASYYYYCDHGSCHGLVQFSGEAIKGCEKFGHGRCVILASNGAIKRPYTVAN